MSHQLSRWQNTIIVGAVGILLAMLQITEHFTVFLEILANIFSPLVGVALMDYFAIRRCRPDVEAIYQAGSSARYSRGINLVAWAAVIFGVVVAIFTPEYLLVSIVSMGASAGLYWGLMRLIYPALFIGQKFA